ncbi:helix-turn-helix domain-containing protein [Paenibacillus jiagnxiensis]|uniref:helix-turn-helix domain-containing protein n=1 Tax=Paenibacillus jiagnxiensis TaxID=3228926 RepID=UPI0033A3B7BA
MKEHRFPLLSTLFELNTFQHIRVESGGVLDMPEISFLRLIVIVKGKGELRATGHHDMLSRNKAFLLPDHIKAQIKNYTSTELELQCITFEMFRLSARTNESLTYSRVNNLPFVGAVPVASYIRIQRLMHQLGREHGEGEHLFSRQHAWMQEIIEELTPKNIGNPPIFMPPSFQQSIRFLQKEFDKPIALHKLAQIAGVHPTYYSSMFKLKMGRTPIEYLTAVRMNRAKELLIKTGDKVRDIARQVGYKDEFYFSRRFKEQYGIAPTVYIKQSTYSNIVPLSYAYTDHLFTLGVIPSAAQIDKGFDSIARRVPIPLVRAESWDLRREALLQVKPDLVVCKENISLQARENIGDIAPVIVVPWMQKDIFAHLAEISALVDREKAAVEWIHRHEHHVEQARKKVKAVIGDASVTICSVFGDECRIYADRNMGHVFYRSLGLRAPERLQAVLNRRDPGTEVNWMGIPLESVLDFPSEYLLLVTRSKKEAAQKLRQLQSYPGWETYPAVKLKQVYTLDWSQWIVYAPYSIGRQLKMAVDLLTKPL